MGFSGGLSRGFSRGFSKGFCSASTPAGLMPTLGVQRAFQLNITGLRRAIFCGLGCTVWGLVFQGETVGAPKIKNTFVESWARTGGPRTPHKKTQKQRTKSSRKCLGREGGRGAWSN